VNIVIKVKQEELDDICIDSIDLEGSVIEALDQLDLPGYDVDVVVEG